MVEARSIVTHTHTHTHTRPVFRVLLVEISSVAYCCAVVHTGVVAYLPDNNVAGTPYAMYLCRHTLSLAISFVRTE